MHFNIKEHIIFKTIAGSKLYGLDGPNSDTDYRSVCLPPLKIITSPFLKFETKIDHEIDDEETHTLEKVIHLASQCNPNVIELLYVPDEYIITSTWQWETIRTNRDLFLSKEAEFRFKGYAIGQLLRAERHRRWLIDPPKAEPVRSDFGLVSGREIPKDQFIAFMAILDKNLFGQIPQWQFLTREQRSLLYEELAKLCFLYNENLRKEDRYSVDIEEDLKLDSANYLGFGSDFIEIAKREKRYYSALGEWKSYQKWLADRNPDRAQLEAKFGYDTKHISHTLRLLHMANEIAIFKCVYPDRRNRDADFLKDIKFRGIWSFEQIADYVEKLKVAITESYQESTLPVNADRNKIADIYYNDIIKLMI